MLRISGAECGGGRTDGVMMTRGCASFVGYPASLLSASLKLSKGYSRGKFMITVRCTVKRAMFDDTRKVASSRLLMAVHVVHGLLPLGRVGAGS